MMGIRINWYGGVVVMCRLAIVEDNTLEAGRGHKVKYPGFF